MTATFIDSSGLAVAAVFGGNIVEIDLEAAKVAQGLARDREKVSHVVYQSEGRIVGRRPFKDFLRMERRRVG